VPYNTQIKNESINKKNPFKIKSSFSIHISLVNSFYLGFIKNSVYWNHKETIPFIHIMYNNS